KRTARSRTSGENLFALFLLMARILSRVGASAKPGAIQFRTICLFNIPDIYHFSPTGLKNRGEKIEVPYENTIGSMPDKLL
ncbi:hypothetical protein ACOTCH_30625, partial [Achromobacter xylosoxidans]